MNLHKLLVAIRLVGFRGVIQSLCYPVVKWLIERRFPLPRPSGPLQTPGRLVGAESAQTGALVRFERAELEIRFLSADLVRLTWTPGTLPVPYAIARTEWPDVPVGARAEAGTWTFTTSALDVAIGPDGSVRCFDASGHLLREDLPPRWRGDEITHQTRLRPDERIHGLGNRTLPMNLRGLTLKMWNRDPGAGHSPGDDPIYLCVPVYLSIHGDGSHLAFYENSFRATFAFHDTAEARFDGGALRYYVISGPPARATERYTELTGRPPMPPRWALGYHQSRWSYDTDAEVREIAEGFRSRDLPLGAIHLDIDYMDGFKVFTADPRHFADLGGLARDLLDRGVQLVAILDPGVKRDRDYDIFADGEAEKVYCALPDGSPAAAPVWPGWCAFPDFTDARVRAWWGRYYPRLLDSGIAGLWHDMNEPAAFAARGDPSLPVSTRHHMEGRGGTHLEAHNLYGLLENRAGYEALRALRPDRRPFIVSRSGWAGTQRYAWNWTGDIESTWQALRQTVVTVIGLGLSGVPYTGPDVGGFSGTPSAELYVRWLQLAAFLPFFRTHSAKHVPRREPWSFGEPALGIARDTLRLRSRFLPYFYTLAWEASRTGYPLVRPLFWPDGKDPTLWDVHDEFFLGDALLVAPVLQEGAQSREVTLPGGTWYELANDRPHRGPRQFSIEAPLGRIPVLVRAGVVLPTEEPRMGDAAPTLVLHAYPPEDHEGGSILYCDAGDGYGPARVDTFRLRLDGSTLRLSWTTEGDYAFPYAGVEVVVHGMRVRRARVDGEEVPCEGGRIRKPSPFREASFEP